MEPEAKATNKKDRTGDVKPMLRRASKQPQPPLSTGLTDLGPDTQDELACLPPLPPTPDPEVTNQAENAEPKG